jgi:cell division protein FtsL
MVSPVERARQRKEKTGPRKGIVQAFKQAPWRLQVQTIGLYLLGLVIVIVIASVYLSISGRAAAAGLRAYQMNLQRQDLERQIADRKSQIAILTSSMIMEQRATELGFKRITPDDVIYMEIPGYLGKQSAVLAPPPGVTESAEVAVRSIYRQSLWDWLFSGINNLSDSVIGGNG